MSDVEVHLKDLALFARITVTDMTPDSTLHLLAHARDSPTLLKSYEARSRVEDSPSGRCRVFQGHPEHHKL